MLMNVNGLSQLEQDLKARGFEAYLNTACTQLLVQLAECPPVEDVARIIFAALGQKVEVLEHSPLDGIFLVQPEA